MECQEKGLLLAQKVSFLGKSSPKIIFLPKKIFRYHEIVMLYELLS